MSSIATPQHGRDPSAQLPAYFSDPMQVAARLVAGLGTASATSQAVRDIAGPLLSTDAMSKG